ncbi:MAG: hypothetical protein GW855_07895 [Erythrobacter sp.]|nr:hypothetical protein [Erythrobacter sp.]NCQ62460.1 hypothetical protein [Alphaproteobacteria bacterium]
MKSILVGLGAIALVTVAAIAAAPLVSELASAPFLVGAAVAIGAAFALFAPEPFILNNRHPRSIFETRRAGLA